MRPSCGTHALNNRGREKEGRAIARQLRSGDRYYRGKQVRLISHDNEQLGFVSYEDALIRAQAAGLDLVEMSAKADPPVCRMMDYGKHQYEQSKRQREAKKKQHQQKVKEVKFHPNIDQHDYQTKLNHMFAFLQKGFKVKVSMFFRGREMAHTELGDQLMRRVIADAEEHAAVDAPPRRSGRQIAMMLSPKVRK